VNVYHSPGQGKLSAQRQAGTRTVDMRAVTGAIITALSRAEPVRCRARCGVVTGKSFRRGAGLTR